MVDASRNVKDFRLRRIMVAMQSKATTVEAYLAELPEDRRAALEALRRVFLKNIDKKLEEGMQYGMVGYYVPHSVYPAGYHCDPKQPLPFAGMSSQKNHMSLYMMCLYSSLDNENWLRTQWAKTGKKLDMGKSCIRFKKLEDLPLDVIGEAIKRITVKKYIEHYEASIRTMNKAATKRAATGAKKTAKKAATKRG